MTIALHAAVDPGRARSNNEDSVATDASASLAVLADGMGGYNAGEVAANMATSFIGTELGRWLREASTQASDAEVRRAMDICVDNANRAIYDASNAHPQYAGMGTTLVVAVFREGRLLLGHVGDSRCYRLRGGRLSQLTRDHSLLQEQIDAGLITPEQAAFSANKNLVTRAVGVEDGVLLETQQHEVQSDDLYLLCSDGLSDMLDDAAITQLLLEHGSMGATAGVGDTGSTSNIGGTSSTGSTGAGSAGSTGGPQALGERTHLAQALETTTLALIAAANDAGGKDNIAVILVRACGGANATAKSWWPFRR
jgi:protein phosphatase